MVINKRRREKYKANKIEKDNIAPRSEYHKKYYEVNKDTIKANVKKYNKTPNGRVSNSIANYNRKARENKTAYNFTIQDWKECMEHFDNKCCYCGKETDVLHQEHFIPLKLGGEYTKQNIVPSCQYCNYRKHAKLFSNWYPSYEHYDEKREKNILKYLGYKNNVQQLSVL